MVAIDNFEHVSLAYGSGVAARAVAQVRRAVLQWFGRHADIQFESGGIIYGAVPRPLLPAQRDVAERDAVNPQAWLNRLLVNPPVVFLPHDGGTICLSISGSWAEPDDGAGQAERPFSSGCRVPFFGEMPGRGAAWAERYRADMAIVASVLGAIPREQERDGYAAAGPVVTGAADPAPCSTAGPVFRMVTPREPIVRCQPDGVPPAEPMVFAWRPVRDGQSGRDVLFYELIPQLCGRDGLRRDLAECRPVLERLGFAVALDQYLVASALDLLEADPDVAVAVQVSAQSVSTCPRWGMLFRRLTGCRSVASRLTLAITETASFPDFAEAIQFVSRLQTFGCAVAIDNFGLGYEVELFESGAALLERARQGLSGCIVLDVRMPGVSGLEVQKRLATLDIHTPVIVVSGFADIAMAVQAMKSNAFEFLTKPFRDQDLFDAIGAAMELDSSRTMQSQERRHADRLMRNLTAREHEVFVRLCLGQVGKQIAHDLGMSEATVKVHRRSILHKLSVKHLGELILNYAPIVRRQSEEQHG
ncbi:response regulator [Novosphingobium piscinae]|uniref:Response regulator n=1 Tax=Novosphingobium piscinae TaxID=1507448 RepID=A0A7X1FYT3_9SPHN|nr:response regulator [Novosphingobium piscinae]MBC2668902.1 response regulator [Novosphingobium piscinae]